MKEEFGDDANFLDDSPIRTIVIRNWPTDYFLYVIFLRLNSGSLPLSPQELRRAIQPGEMLDYIDDYLERSDIVKKALGLKKLDRRMRDAEIVLRFVSFNKQYPNYGGNLKDFLDETVKYYNTKWVDRKSELDDVLARLDTALAISSKVFKPDELFRKWNGVRFERQMNRAIFDAVTRYFVDPSIEDAAVQNRDRIVAEMKEICIDNDEFRRSIESAAKTPHAVKTRLELWGRKLAGIIGWKFDPVRYRVDR